MTITQIFTQKYVSTDEEGREWVWKDTNETYFEAAEELITKNDGRFDAVRLIEKTFDSNTFQITDKVLKEIEKVYENLMWNGEIEETIYE